MSINGATVSTKTIANGYGEYATNLDNPYLAACDNASHKPRCPTNRIRTFPRVGACGEFTEETANPSLMDWMIETPRPHIPRLCDLDIDCHLSFLSPLDWSNAITMHPVPKGCKKNLSNCVHNIVIGHPDALTINWHGICNARAPVPDRYRAIRPYRPAHAIRRRPPIPGARPHMRPPMGIPFIRMQHSRQSPRAKKFSNSSSEPTPTPSRGRRGVWAEIPRKNARHFTLTRMNSSFYNISSGLMSDW